CESLAELADGGHMTSVRLAREAEMWDGNGALGKVPIVARLEVRRAGSWEAVAGEQIHFQLISPFHDDPGAELADVDGLRDSGPRPFVREAIAHAFDEHDPQRYDAHESRGGKRGRAVLGSIFDRLPVPVFPDMGAPEASPAPRAHAVRVTTNAAGEA